MQNLPYCHIYGQMDQTGDRFPDELQHLLDLGLTCDLSIGLEQARKHRKTLDGFRNTDGLIAPTIYPKDLEATCRDSNWWKYPTEQCFELLQKASDQFANLDLGPLQAVNTYTPGNSFVAACRKAQIRYILGFCAPIVIEDGGWEIAHYGSPLSPYFASDEDFRKPEAPGQRSDPVLISSMELRNPMVCMNHWSEGPWCPLNALAADRTLEPGSDPLPFLQIAEDWLRESELTGNPLFFHINLQYFFTSQCYEHNRRALEWLARQRDNGRLSIGGLKGWEQQLAGQGGFKRQTTYWRGEMMGFHVGHRPGCFPDVIVDECLDHQSIWQAPDPLPRRFYDYRKTWNHPAFEPQGSAPESSHFNNIKVEAYEAGGNSSETIIEIHNSGATQSLSLALWDLFKGWEEGGTVDVKTPGWTARVVPHPTGVGGTALLEGQAGSGVTRVVLSASGTKRSLRSSHRAWGHLVAAETFFHNGRPYTILAAQTPEPFAISAKIHGAPFDDKPLTQEYLLGIEHGVSTIVNNECVLRFDGTRLVSWQRLWGVSADQIELTGVEKIESQLACKTASIIQTIAPEITVSAPGLQLFGNIRDTSRWDRALARKAGDAEMGRINEWFHKQRPGIGEVVIEAHPGIYLPQGSITKVLGHEFDVIRCAEGYGLKELCVDYPQAWDWGVAAWVQWRHLRLQIDGLQHRGGTHLLHLHAFDPERRDICQRVEFYNPEAHLSVQAFPGLPIHNKPVLCGVLDWQLPAGTEGRWDANALCSIAIPPECLEWPAIALRIVPQEKLHLYDWISERGSPGLISHLWVTRA